MNGVGEIPEAVEEQRHIRLEMVDLEVFTGAGGKLDTDSEERVVVPVVPVVWTAPLRSLHERQLTARKNLRAKLTYEDTNSVLSLFRLQQAHL